ncbi:hypothetical protein [Kitasatospora sp. NPDC058046]|uniref:hypothetical protein n=1 Tax=Kitasatospora sp. NPDC058046 TaxID=3346312 RepID=UPI0036DCF1CC
MPPELTPDQREEIIRRYQDDGVSVYRLAREYGRRDMWLRARLATWGVTLRSYAEARAARAWAPTRHDGDPPTTRRTP